MAQTAPEASPPKPSPPWSPPPFCRTSWSSEAARTLWEPRLATARAALEDLAVLRVADGEPARTAIVRASSLARLGALAARCGTPLFSLGAAPHSTHGVAAGRTGRLRVAIGGDAGAPDAAPSWEDQVWEDRAELDPVWRIALATPDADTADDGREVTVSGGWASNPLLAPLGLAAVAPWPSGFDCALAIAEGEALVAAAQAHGLDEAIGHLREALSWPIAWSALHGVAEIKTPVFRYVRDTPPTPSRLSVRRLGATLPEESARGLSFPFRVEPRLRTESPR